MNDLRRVLGTEPTLIATAIRLTLLAIAVFGVDLDPEEIVALMAALEAWLAVYARANVTPEVKVVEREREALAAGHAAGREAASVQLLELDTAQHAAKVGAAKPRPRKAAR